MAYTYNKQLWKDYPDTSTPITADRLNHMEDGISEAAKSGGGDTIPVGSEFDYDGTTVPDGYEEVNNVLYNNETGTTGNITLSDDSSNYSYIEIYFTLTSSKNWSFTKVSNPNGKADIILSQMLYNSQENKMRIFAENISINGTTLSRGTQHYQTVGTTGNAATTSITNITKVVGYK